MDIFGIGGLEMAVVMLLAIIVLGPSRLVKTAREAGRLMRDVKAYFQAFSDELKTEMEVMDDLKEIRRDLRS